MKRILFIIMCSIFVFPASSFAYFNGSGTNENVYYDFGQVFDNVTSVTIRSSGSIAVSLLNVQNSTIWSESVPVSSTLKDTTYTFNPAINNVKVFSAFLTNSSSVTNVSIFNGSTLLKSSGDNFTKTKPIPSPTPTPSATPEPTPSPTPTATPAPTSTPSPTATPTATPKPTVPPAPTPTPEPDQPGDRAILVITMVNGAEKEYDLPMAEVDSFLKWYDLRDAGRGPGSYAVDKHTNNKGPFSKRKDYVVFDKILTFEVSEYTAK